MVRRGIATAAILLGLAGASPVAAALAAPGSDHDPNPNKDKHHWCQGKNVPAECETPEAPIPAELPLAGVLVTGAFVFLVRRTHIVPNPSK